MIGRDKVRPVNRSEWDDLSHRFLDHSYQQTWVYACALAERRHCECEHVAINVDGELIGVASVRVKHMPVIRGGVAYVVAGESAPSSLAGDYRQRRLAQRSRCLE